MANAVFSLISHTQVITERVLKNKFYNMGNGSLNVKANSYLHLTLSVLRDHHLVPPKIYTTDLYTVLKIP